MKYDWISVIDGLPPTKQTVDTLCYDSYHGKIRVLVFNSHHQCWDDESGDDYYCDAIGGNVTHWMPLPEPPKR